MLALLKSQKRQGYCDVGNDANRVTVGLVTVPVRLYWHVVGKGRAGGVGHVPVASESQCSTGAPERRLDRRVCLNFVVSPEPTIIVCRPDDGRCFERSTGRRVFLEEPKGKIQA